MDPIPEYAWARQDELGKHVQLVKNWSPNVVGANRKKHTACLHIVFFHDQFDCAVVAITMRRRESDFIVLPDYSLLRFFFSGLSSCSPDLCVLFLGLCVDSENLCVPI